MNYDCNRPTSRVIRPPGGGSSNIFGGDEPVKKEAPKSNPSYQSSVFGNNGTPETPQSKPKPVRHDPITGEVIGAKDVKKEEKKEQEVEEKAMAAPEAEKENESNETSEKINDPHLGAVRNLSGVRCAQPPGGRCTLTLG